jgi:acetyl-CoA carboxylase biotin carboxylase subunit
VFRKVLVANRGEIAVRIIRALAEMGIPSVAVYSDVDRAALHVRMADEAAHLGPPPSTESYLRIDKIIAAAKQHSAEAIHPGYGFLSENADFAEACEQAGIVFIGPRPASIRAMGSKTAARKTAISIGAPVVPGTEDAVSDPGEARQIADRIGYPVLIKAAAGGGGKGMRRVDSAAELESALRDAASEAERAFSNSAVYIEKLVERPRHIEIQIMGDRFGNMVHFGERECSIQRRHQKVIEECPSPLIAAHPEMRAVMGAAAVNIARAVGYYNAGTIEFLVDAHRNFYFLEMNTRLQVEHPVTELATGFDLVQMQVRIAAGQPLGITQQDIAWRGSAIECRIYAEDPNNNFLPSPGTMQHVERPSGPGVRLDTGIYPGWTVPMEYDPLLAKLAVWAETRQDAIARMKRALGEYYVSGIRTNITFFRQILEDPEFQTGHLHTGFIDEFLRRSAEPAEKQDPEYEAMAALAAAIFSLDQKKAPAAGSRNGARAATSRWASEGRDWALR